ncbi:MAG TPA: hypothetical protein VIQ11_20810 [Mycobacterium sp.]
MKSVGTTIFAVLFCLATGILCAAWTITTVSRGGYLTALVTAAGAVSVAAFTLWILRMKLGELTVRVTSAPEGTTVRPDRLGDLLLRTSMSSGVSAMAVFAVLEPIGLLDIPIPHSARYYIPFMSAVGALSGAPVVIRAFARGSMSYLRLTRKGFEFAEGRHPERGRWDSVQDIADRAPERPAPKGPSIVMVMRDGATPTIAVGAYSPEGSAVRRMVQFYWKHPDHRDELMDGRAVQRLRDDDFGQARRKLG